MRLNIAALCGLALLGVAIACGQPPTPASPSTTPATSDAAGAGGATMKIGAPGLVSPINGAQIDTGLILVITTVKPAFTSVPITYEAEVRNAAGTLIANPRFSGSGSQATVAVNAAFDFDSLHTWRVRATYNALVGPWSEAGSFRTSSGGYIKGSEIFDPLTNGKTVGVPVGPVTFIPGVGAKMTTQTAHIDYQLPVTLTAGEMSMMISGIDEGSAGGKSKVFSMQEGPDLGNITDDAYRFTGEYRGRDYSPAGSVAFRIICGDEISRDGARQTIDFSDTKWYFWKFTWKTGTAQLVVRADGPTGSIMYDQTIGTGSHAYSPNPHLVHIGAPVGRAGENDATIFGLIAKNLWVSAGARPTFPGLTGLLGLPPR